MAGHVRGAMSHGEIDVGALFEKYTIDEIRDIEKKTRQDIEKKKEDLRHMVGERYRDLIEAADTITEMKRSSDSVMQSITRMQELCNNLKQSFTSSSHRSTTHSDRTNELTSKLSHQRLLLCSMAVNLKLLMDMPERIWSALDAGRYLLSTRLYLLARHIYSTVQIDPQAAHIISPRFPLLARQWTTICHFRTAILQTCRARLKDVSASDEEVSECLCSILLLEDFTSQQVFNEFVTVRLDAVQQLFRADSTDASVRSQVCDVMLLIVTTVHQIYAVFCCDEVVDSNKQVCCNLLVTMLEQITSKGQTGNILTVDDVSAPSQKYLSKSVIDFRPTTRHQLMPVPPATLRASSLQFLDRCVVSVRQGLVKLLSFVTSVKGLTAVRDELWNQLKQDIRLLTWDIVCSHVLGRKLHIWTELASEIFVLRVEELLQGQFDATVTAGKTQINKVLVDVVVGDDRSMQYEKDLSRYVWTESAQDMPAGQLWSTGGAPGQSAVRSFTDHSTLMMKARGYTPTVQTLCRGLDQRLKLLLDDANHYVVRPQSSLSPTATQLAVTSDEPFDRFSDKKRIHEFVQNACESCITKQLEHLQVQLDGSKKELLKSATTEDANQNIIYRLLLMGRFTSALCELSPNLQLCMCHQLNEELTSSTVVTRLLSKKSTVPTPRSLSKNADNSRWCLLRDRLIKFSNDAYSLWTEYICKLLLTQFQLTLNNRTGSSLLKSCTQWDNIEIEEETEDNKVVKSTIRVPMQASWYVQTLLYKLCEDINKMGGQTMPVSSLSSLVHRLLEGILAAYDKLLDDCAADSRNLPAGTMTQIRALQLLFDVQFLMNILGHRDDSETAGKVQKQLLKIIEKLESHIDPFDLDVFSTYIQNHLSRQTQRSSVLYGSLMAADKRGALYSGPSTLGTQQEQHNVLPLASCQNRFPLLPLSSQNRSTTATVTTIQPIVQAPKSKNALPSASSGGTDVVGLPVNVISPQRATSSSFLEQMSTIWFSNVGGK
jgi:hypothetical protein